MLNCEAIQDQLLRCEDPARPPAGLLRHLGQCSECQAFRRRLVEVEDGLRQLPVPVSTRGQRMVARLQEGELPTPALSESRPSPWRSTLKERTQQKIALTLTLAALLALFTFGWGVWPRGIPDANQKRQEHARLVHKAPTPRQAAQQAVAFVRQLESDVLTALNRSAEADIDLLADFYVELVEVDLLERVKALSPGDRSQVLPALVEQLRQSESTLSRAQARLADPSEGLARMTEAARVGQARLRQMPA